jgi:hypothetical protein
MNAAWRRPAVPRSRNPLCVYAIVRPGTSQAVWRTRDGERLHVIRRGAIAAVVSETSRPPAATAANLRRHDRTMRTLAARFSALLPARFGTCVSEEELMFILSSRAAAFARALAQVRNRTQMTVRIVGLGKGDAARLPPRSGADYLRARARETRIPEFEPVRAAVKRWVRAERAERRAGVATVYQLIPRASAEAYRDAAERAGAAAGLQMIVSGPWPPYAFGSD